jgi:hypothetical protein
VVGGWPTVAVIDRRGKDVRLSFHDWAWLVNTYGSFEVNDPARLAEMIQVARAQGFED